MGGALTTMRTSTATDAHDLPYAIYTPASPLRQPGLFVRQMISDLINSHELAWRLFVRDVSAQYRQSMLGYLWIFIPPLAASLPFIYVNTQGIMTIGETPIPYAAYAIVGTTIWQVFVDALNAPLRTVSLAKPVLIRVNLPREAIFLSGLAHVVLGFVVRLVLLIGVLAWFHIVPKPSAMLFPIGIFSLMVVGFVIGLLITPLGILYSDVQQALPIATTFLMLLTPVVYPPPRTGIAAAIAAYNPLSPLVESTRDWITVGTSAHLASLCAITLTAFAGLLLAWAAVRVAMPHLIARVGS
jgi:lipopolysaccharide transport system permease protein